MFFPCWFITTGSGCGSKLKRLGYAGFSLWFHLPRCHFGTFIGATAKYFFSRGRKKQMEEFCFVGAKPQGEGCHGRLLSELPHRWDDPWAGLRVEVHTPCSFRFLGFGGFQPTLQGETKTTCLDYCFRCK